jgi:hypothetical protein
MGMCNEVTFKLVWDVRMFGFERGSEETNQEEQDGP